MDQNKEQGLQIDFLKLAQVVLRRWWVIVMSGLLCAALFLGYTIGFVSPQYQSSVLLYVNTTRSATQTVGVFNADINLAKTLVNTYCVILKTRLTLEDVSANLKNSGLDYSYSALNGMISYSSVNDTEVFKITVTCSNPSDACTIANTVAQVLPEKIASVINGASVRVVDYAVVSNSRISPSYSKQTFIGFAVGAAVAVAILAALYLLNDTITSEEWLLNNFKDEIPLLATIPDANQNGSRSTRYGSKYGYKYGNKYSNRYGYSYGYGNKTRYGGNYGGYRYGYRNGYYGSKSQFTKAPEPVEHIESL